MEVALLRRNDRVRFGLAASQVWNTVPASHLKITASVLALILAFNGLFYFQVNLFFNKVVGVGQKIQ